MATVHANQILNIFMLFLGGHCHCVKVSSDSETVRGMGLWEFSGALRELMLTVSRGKCKQTSFKQTLKSELFLIISWDLFNIGTKGWYR